MYTDEIREKYRTTRRTYPGLPAEQALRWARHTPRYPDIEWTDGHHLDVLTGTGQADGFDVRVFVSADPEPDGDGVFTDEYRPGAVPNPQWRPSRGGRTLRWYVSSYANTVDAHRRDLSRAGWARHRAYTEATRYMREEAERAAEPERYVIRALAYRNGLNLSETSVWNFDVPDDRTEARKQFINQAEDMISEAVHQARTQLEKLTVDGAGATLAEPAPAAGLSITLADTYADAEQLAEAMHLIAAMVADGYTYGIYPHRFELHGKATTAEVTAVNRAEQ